MNKKTIFEIIVIHGEIVLTIVFFILLYLDKVNPAMNFIGNPQAKFLLLLLCFFSIINGIRLAIGLHRRRLDEYRRRFQKDDEE